MIGYKFTDHKMKTHGGFQWEIGRKATTTGEGELCGPGFLHYYADPLLAVLLAPLHVNFGPDRRLFRVEAGGVIKNDRGLKLGASELTLLEEIPVPVVAMKQRAAFAAKCAEWAKEAARGPRLAPAEIGAKLTQFAREACE